MQKAPASATKGPTGKDVQPYEKSPIYRVMRDILRDSHVATARMGKGYKFTLGEAIRKYAQEATETVFLAYEERTDPAVKLVRIQAIKPALHRLLINYRIANDLQQVERSIYVEQVERIVSAMRQSEGWEQFASSQKAGNGQSLTTTGSQGVPLSRTTSPGGGHRPAQR